MGYRRRVARSPRCSIKLFRKASAQGAGALVAYLKVCGTPPVPRRVKRQRVVKP